MVNPQREHGHIDIANTIAEHFCKYRLSGEEWQVLWVILRKTYGWHKKQYKIALSQFSDMTGLPRPTCVRALSKLITKGVIQKDNTYITTYSFVKVYTHWKVLSKQIPRGVAVIQKDNKTVINLDNQVLSKKIHTKETITKEKKESRPKAHLDDLEFIEKLKTSIAYKHINMDVEMAKMDAWLMTRPGRKKSRRFIVNWLNKIDAPVVVHKVINKIINTQEPKHEPMTEEQRLEFRAAINKLTGKMSAT